MPDPYSQVRTVERPAPSRGLFARCSRRVNSLVLSGLWPRRIVEILAPIGKRIPAVALAAFARWPLVAVGLGACVREAPAPPQSRPPDQRALDSVASWKAPMTAEFYHQLRGWVFRSGDSAVMAVGTRSFTEFSPAGVAADAATLREGEAIFLSPDGSRVGRTRRDAELVIGFELLDISGRTIWSHAPLGHHYYQVGTGGRLTIGHTSSTAHPGKPGSVGTFTFYDSTGTPQGRFACGQSGATEIAPDAAAVLIECRDSALAVVDRRGRLLLSLPGSFRNARISAGGRVLAAVPVAQPRNLTIAALDSAGAIAKPVTVEFTAPVRQVAMTPDGKLVVATSGAEVIALSGPGGQEVWRAPLEGANAITSLAVSPSGLVAVGARGGPASATEQRPELNPALIAVLRDGRVRFRADFELDRMNVWTPSVALDPGEGQLLVWGPAEVWSIRAARWLGR